MNEELDLFLNNLPQKVNQFAEYLDLGKKVRVFEGESLINNHLIDKDGFLFYIKLGKFKLSVERPDGSKLDFAYCPTGSIIQKNTVINSFDIFDSSDVIALENAEVISFTKEQLYEFIAQDKILFNEYIDNLSNYLLLLKQRTLLTAGLTSSHRLLTWLNKLARLAQKDADGDYTVPCTLSQQQIADLLFIHVTTCNKLFGQLHREGILQRTKKHIVIYQPNKLKQYLEEDLKIIY